jgi:hypothetical protein
MPVLGPIMPPLLRVKVTVTLGVNWQGRKIYHSPLSTVKVKNGEATPPLFPTSSWRGA